MDEQNQKTAGEESAVKKSGRPNRHRPHRRRPAHADGTGSAPAAAETAVKQAQEPSSEKGDGEKKNNPHHGNRNRKKPHNGKPTPKNGGNPDSSKENPEKKDAPKNTGERRTQGEKNHKKDGKKRSRSNGGNPYTKRGLEDIYGTPTEDDVLTMEELRAKIVLKSADGSVPAEEQAEEKKAEEPKTPDYPSDPELLFTTADPFAQVIPEIPEEDRVEVVGVRFRSAGKVYYFDPKGKKFSLGDFAIVETARGPEFGEISFANKFVNKNATVSPLRPVMRAASPEDIRHNEENREREKQALGICQEKILKHKLDMKLIDVQYAFDNSRLLFYFTSEGRVDFRDLVKDLASVFHTRIELRQIGIRDEAKMLGGLGACGRPLCCATFLPDFVQVSIKMAKEQGLSLNSSKISGVCGRLMCCLRYESEVYAEEIKRTPGHNATVKTPDGIGTVVSSNPLAGTVKVILKSTPDAPPKQYSRDELTVLGKESKQKPETDPQEKEKEVAEVAGTEEKIAEEPRAEEDV